MFDRIILKSIFLFFGAVLFFSPLAVNAIDCPSGFTKKDQICVPENPFQSGGGVASAQNANALIVQIIKAALLISGSLAILFIIIGGFRYMTARGNTTSVAAARKTILAAVIGLVVIVLSYVLVSVVSNVALNTRI